MHSQMFFSHKWCWLCLENNIPPNGKLGKSWSQVDVDWEGIWKNSQEGNLMKF